VNSAPSNRGIPPSAWACDGPSSIRARIKAVHTGISIGITQIWAASLCPACTVGSPSKTGLLKPKKQSQTSLQITTLTLRVATVADVMETSITLTGRSGGIQVPAACLIHHAPKKPAEETTPRLTRNMLTRHHGRLARLTFRIPWALPTFAVQQSDRSALRYPSTGDLYSRHLRWTFR